MGGGGEDFRGRIKSDMEKLQNKANLTSYDV